MQGTVQALARLVDARDACTGEHSQHVGRLVQGLAEALGLSPADVQMVTLAGQLHDIGKIALPDSLLQKCGKLNDEELVLMRTHPAVGAEVVSHVPVLRPIAPLILAHHEQWSGQGYPHGLAGEAIPLGARIIAVADAFSAMTTNHPYQQARSEAEVLVELQRSAGRQFDPTVVEAFACLINSTSQQESLLQPIA